MAQVASNVTNITDAPVTVRRTRGPRKIKPQSFTIMQAADGTTKLHLSIDGGKGMALPMQLEQIKSTVWDAVQDGALITLHMVKAEQA